MNDNFGKVKGYFKIEAINLQGEVIDKFEKHNLIMDNARRTFPNYIASIAGTQPINKFVLGTNGHIAGDILAPKNEIDGFVSEREMLFSEETGMENVDFETLTFNPNGVSGDTNTCDDGKSTVKITVVDTDVIYEVNVHNLSCNGDGTIVFTECAFYTGDDIFSMRTFKGKIKDDSVSLRITWKIMF